MELTLDRRRVFLRELAEHGVVAQAARAASPHSERGCVMTFRDMKARDPVFSEAWDAAVEQANAALEMEIRRRGFEGFEETRTDSKGRVTVLHRYSDSCLLAMARARIAAYRKNDVAIEHDVKQDTPLADAVKEVAARLAAEMRAAGRAEVERINGAASRN